MALTSGRPRAEIAEDLGVGLSSLMGGQYRDEEMPPEIKRPAGRVEAAAPREFGSRQSACKKSRGLLREGGKSMRFALIACREGRISRASMCRQADVKGEKRHVLCRYARAARQSAASGIMIIRRILGPPSSYRTEPTAVPRMHRELVDEGLPISTPDSPPDERLAARPVVSNEPRTVRTPGRSCPICWTKTSRQRRSRPGWSGHSVHPDQSLGGSDAVPSTWLTTCRRLGSQRQAEEGFGAACPEYGLNATPAQCSDPSFDRGSRPFDYQAVLRKHDLLILR